MIDVRDLDTIPFRRAVPASRPAPLTFAPPQPRTWPWLVGVIVLIGSFARPIDPLHGAHDRRLSALVRRLTGP